MRLALASGRKSRSQSGRGCPIRRESEVRGPCPVCCCLNARGPASRHPPYPRHTVTRTQSRRRTTQGRHTHVHCPMATTARDRAARTALPASGLAQTGAASITGLVSDQSGSAVPGVTVTATNQATGVAYTAVSNEVGNYTIALGACRHLHRQGRVERVPHGDHGARDARGQADRPARLQDGRRGRSARSVEVSASRPSCRPKRPRSGRSSRATPWRRFR